MTTDTAQTSFRSLADFITALTPERREEYRQAVIERLGFDPTKDRGRGIGIAEATRLAGVLPGTGTQWRRRTKVGGIAKPFPDPKPKSPTGKPLYDPMKVAAWLDWTKRWPPGTAARRSSRTPEAA